MIDKGLQGQNVQRKPSQPTQSPSRNMSKGLQTTASQEERQSVWVTPRKTTSPQKQDKLDTNICRNTYQALSEGGSNRQVQLRDLRKELDISNHPSGDG